MERGEQSPKPKRRGRRRATKVSSLITEKTFMDIERCKTIQ